MDHYLLDLRRAFKNVETFYFEHEALNANRELYRQVAENNFTSELRHQFRNLMESPCNQARYVGLQLHHDILKNLPDRRIEPDLVLHAGQNNHDQQKIYAEVKLRFAPQELRQDIDKLVYAISDVLNFEYGVMIVLNESLDRTKRVIRDHLDQTTKVEDLLKLRLYHAAIQVNGRAKYSFANFCQIKRDVNLDG